MIVTYGGFWSSYAKRLHNQSEHMLHDQNFILIGSWCLHFVLNGHCDYFSFGVDET